MQNRAEIGKKQKVERSKNSGKAAHMKNFKTSESKKLYRKANRYLAGGVGSHARSREAGYNPYPLYMKKGEGARIYDVDGHEYIDYLMALGPLFFGHKPKEIFDKVFEEVSETGTILGAPYQIEYLVAKKLVKLIPCFELVRFTSSGSEAVMAALRLARAYTGKTKIVRFEGHYHGWADCIHIGSTPELNKNTGRIVKPIKPSSPGIPRTYANDIIVLPWNQPKILAKILKDFGGKIAAVITEPVMCNTGVILPKDDYLHELRLITEQCEVLLIFDEIITGFRLGLGGAQEYFNVKPDLAVFGKALGAGFPVAAYGGKKDIMQLTAEGKVPLGGTFNSNVVAMAAANATLQLLEENSNTIYPALFQKGELLVRGLNDVMDNLGVPAFATGLGPMLQVWFSENRIENYRQAKRYSKPDKYKKFWIAMLKQGVYFHPSPFELWFISTAHSRSDIDITIQKAEKAARLI